jgi:hypothetical protein
MRDLPLDLLYDVTYAWMRREMIHTPEEREVLDSIDQAIIDMDTSYQTGLPASVTAMGIRPANEM